MNKNIENTNRISVLLVSITIVLLLGLAIAFLIISDNNHRSGKSGVAISIAEKNSNNLYEQVSSKVQLLSSHALTISEFDSSTPEETILKHMIDMCKGTSFVKVGISGPKDGIFDFVDSAGTKYLDIDYSKDQVFSNPAIYDNIYVSDYVTDAFAGTDVSYYSVPIKKNGIITGVLCAVNDNLIINEIFSTPLLDGNGYSVLINSEGTILNPESRISPDYKQNINFKESLKFNDGDAAKVTALINSSKTGALEANVAGIASEVALVPIGYHGWFYMVIIPSDVLNQNYNTEMLIFGISSGVFLLAFIFLVLRLSHNLKVNQKILNELAYYDELTGLRNYHKFIIDVDKIINNKKNQRSYYAIWSFDIKQFTNINEIYGRKYGDHVLIRIAEALNKTKDLKSDIFARMSGDQFIGIIRYNNKDELLKWYKRFKDAISNVKGENFKQISFDYRIGFYCIKDFNEDIPIIQMINNAIIARKNFNKDDLNTAFLSEKARKTSRLRMNLENQAKNALLNNEFVFLLQPKVAIHNNFRIAAAEALCRWNSKEYGFISPAVFIPIFEETGFIIDLDRYIFESVCKWYQEVARPRNIDISISVNVSPQGLLRDDFLQFYVNTKNKYQIKDGCLELEFTESVLAHNYDTFHRIVNDLKGNGFLCSIDDFGTGYSSLNLLKNINVDILKLDMLFFRETSNRDKGRIIINGLLKITNYLKIKTVAEGIEDADDVIFLMAGRCDYIQGYIFSKPITPDDFVKLYKDNDGKINYKGSKS